MFASTALAARIERAEVGLTTAIGEGATAAGVPGTRVIRVGAGVAVYAGPHSPVNKMIGIGFDGPEPEDAVREAETVFANAGVPLQAEVSTLVNPGIFGQLVERGYRLHGFENVLALGLEQREPAAVEEGFLRVTRIGDEEAAAWISAVAEGFAHPDDVPAAAEVHPPDALDDMFKVFYGAPGFRRYAAWWDGRLAGGGSLRIQDGIANLCGAATLPAFRRRGIQTALLNARLADSLREGCDLAVVTTAPGSKSQQNAQRRGFSLLYARTLLVKR